MKIKKIKEKSYLEKSCIVYPLSYKTLKRAAQAKNIVENPSPEKPIDGIHYPRRLFYLTQVRVSTSASKYYKFKYNFKYTTNPVCPVNYATVYWGRIRRPEVK